MKSFGYIFKLTAVLLIITAVVAGLLGFVNYLTEGKIAENTEKKAQQAMQSVLPSDSYEELTVSKEHAAHGITKAYTCESGYVVRLNAGGFGGSIDMMVGFDLSGKISGVSVISHSETASLGSKCTDEAFRSQFIGASDDLAVNKDGGSIEALTGATVTSRAVTNGVNTALAYVKEVLG